jgi:hypothetical protein
MHQTSAFKFAQNSKLFWLAFLEKRPKTSVSLVFFSKKRAKTRKNRRKSPQNGKPLGRMCHGLMPYFGAIGLNPTNGNSIDQFLIKNRRPSVLG